MVALKRRAEMNFVAIDPSKASVEIVSANQLTDAYKLVGLKKLEVDHGVLVRLPNDEVIAIVVYEAGLFKGDQGRYFSIGSHLYEGGAVLYAADAHGDTVDLNRVPPVVFYMDVAAVERAISAKEVVRPQRVINNVVTWSWPEVRDFHMNERETELMMKVIKR
jgi:hypothetical protein